MSQFDFMEKLLDGVEVEWKALGEEFPFIRNGFVGTVTPFFTDAENGVRYLQGTNIHNGVISDNAIYHITKGFHQKCSRTELKADDIVMVQSGHVGESAVVGGKYKGSNCHALIVMSNGGKCDSKFVNYYFQSTEGKNKLKKITTGGTVKHILASKMKQFIIPVPSLEIQTEIVRILDAFTAHTAELTAELTARKIQYNYYRDQLLSFEDGEVEWRGLGELATLITKGTTPKSYEQSGISFVKTEAFDGTRINKNKLSYIDKITHHTELKRSMLEADDILFTIAGATIGKSAIVKEDILPANTNQALAIIRLGQTVNKKYVFYILRSNRMRQYIDKNSKGSAQPNLNLEQINSFIVPIPTIAEQARIVAILDKFDALTHSITEGLPREIALRQKQYEYYRDLLLRFPKHPLPASPLASNGTSLSIKY
jgi:type I restriction enzyme S subunit